MHILAGVTTLITSASWKTSAHAHTRPLRRVGHIITMVDLVGMDTVMVMDTDTDIGMDMDMAIGVTIEEADVAVIGVIMATVATTVDLVKSQLLQGSLLKRRELLSKGNLSSKKMLLRKEEPLSK